MISSQLQIQIENGQSSEIYIAKNCRLASTYSCGPPIEATKHVNAALSKHSTFCHQRIRSLSTSMIRDELNIERSSTVERKITKSHHEV